MPSIDLGSNPEKTISELGTVIKLAMAEQALSLRKLSGLCGISPSTISRILSNKQLANIGHLQAFSTHLHIPLTRLLRAYGLDVEEHTHDNSKLIINMMNEILKSYNIELNEVVPEVLRDLKRYEQHAGTSDGNQTIKHGFFKKLDSLNGESMIIDRLHSLYQLYCSEETDPQIRCIVGGALLYLISTPDVIPDYAFPLGYLDDSIAVMLTTKRLADEFDMILL